MKQAAKSDVSPSQRAAEPARSRPVQHTAKDGGHLAQLVAIANSSPRVRALVQLKHAFEHSPRTQNLMALATEIGGYSRPSMPARQAHVAQRLIDPSAITKLGEGHALYKAYQLFEQTLQSAKGPIKIYYEYLQKNDDGADLYFDIQVLKGKKKDDKVLGQTFFEIGDTGTSVLGKLQEYQKPVGGLAGRFIIDGEALKKSGIRTRIVINLQDSDGTVGQLLSTLIHEFGAHAMEWAQFIQFDLQKLGPEEIERYINEGMFEGNLSAVKQHEMLGRGQSEHYEGLVSTYRENLARPKDQRESEKGLFKEESVESRFERAVAEDRYEHNDEEQVRSLQRTRERAQRLINDSSTTPLLIKKKPERKISEPKRSGWCDCCLITTACVLNRGLDDDCRELRILRAFRDGFMRLQPDGPALIEKYYQISPRLVRAILDRPDARAVLGRLYDEMILPAVEMVVQRKLRPALEFYRGWVLRLMDEYLA